jgi:PhnB protein
MAKAQNGGAASQKTAAKPKPAAATKSATAAKPAAAKPAAAKPAKAAKPAVAPIPDGYHTITPSLVVSDGEGAIALYEKALGAEVKGKIHAPGSKKVMHACLQIGDSKIFVADEMPNMPGPKERHASFYLYVEDVDAAHKRALKAGMKELYAPTDMFWGDRTGVVACPYGHHWTLATHIANPTQEEMAEAMKKWAPAKK